MKQQLLSPQPPLLEVPVLFPGAREEHLYPPGDLSLQVHHLPWLHMGIALHSWPPELQRERPYHENQSHKGQDQGKLTVTHRLSEMFFSQSH